MKKYSKRILAGIMSFVMFLTMVFPVQVQAYDGTEADGVAEFSEDNTYALVADGKAAYTTDADDWQKGINFDSNIYDSTNNTITKKTAQFKIIPEINQDGMETGENGETVEIRVKISCCTGDDNIYMELRTENERQHGWIDHRTDNIYIIKIKDNGKYIIREDTENNARYASIDEDGQYGELAFLDTSTEEESAAEFDIIENPEYIDINNDGDDAIEEVPADTDTPVPADTDTPVLTDADMPAPTGTDIPVTVDANTLVTTDSISEDNYAAVSQAAEPAADSVLEEGNYAIISTTTGLALNAKSEDWSQSSIMVDASYISTSGKVAGESAIFTIKKIENTDNVNIIYYLNKKTHPIRVQGDNEFAFTDPQDRYSEVDNQFILEDTGEGTYYIKSCGKNRYATVEDNKLWFKANTQQSAAEKFILEKDPGLLDTSISIENKKTGQYVTTYEAADKSVRVIGIQGDPGTVFSEVKFGKNDNTESKEIYNTATFISKDYGNGIKSVQWDDSIKSAKAELVLTDNEKKNGGGWESIRIVPNGDGTVSFKDSYFDQYITVKSTYLVCRQLEKDISREQLPDEAKFIIHTDSVPNAVTNFEINNKTRTRTSLDLKWKNPEACLYTNIKIEKKLDGEDDSQYKTVVDNLADEESYTVTGLQQKTAYDFRICLEFSNGKDTYSSKWAYASGSTTETDRPAAPKNVHVTEKSPGVLQLSWDKVESANRYSHST